MVIFCLWFVVSPLISLYSLNTLSTETNSIVFNFPFAGKTIPSSFLFSFFFLITDYYFLITSAIAQNFNPTAELVIPIGIASNKANAEIETEPISAEPKICVQHDWNAYMSLTSISFIKSLCFTSSKI